MPAALAASRLPAAAVRCIVSHARCEKTKPPALVFPKPEPKRPTARNAAAVTGRGANAQAYGAERTTLTAQGGGSGQAVPAPNDFSGRDCGDNLTVIRRADAASAFTTAFRRVFVFCSRCRWRAAPCCAPGQRAATDSSVRLHPFERCRRVTGVALADSATRHDRNGPASVLPAGARPGFRRGCD